jgi:hypothetical protein
MQQISLTLTAPQKLENIHRRELQAETARFRGLFSMFSGWKSTVKSNWLRVGDSHTCIGNKDVM